MGWIMLGFAFVALIDLLPLIIQRNLRAILAFIFVFALALTLAIINVMNIDVPPILYSIEKFLRSIGLSYPQP